MAMDFIGLSVGMGYTDETVIGGGALKGKNCVVSNIEEVADGVNVTFQWTLDDGTVQTETVLLPKGTQGETGVDGKSAYDTWLGLGNTGTEKDFIDSLKGSTPEKGVDYWTEEDIQSIEQYCDDYIDNKIGDIDPNPTPSLEYEKGYRDEVIIPDKYNTGCKGELTPWREYFGYDETQTSFYITSAIQGTYGTVYENVNFSDVVVTINKANLQSMTFKNCLFSIDAPYAVNTGSNLDSENVHVTFENCEFCNQTSACVQPTKNFKLINCKIHDMGSDGGKVFDNGSYENCYIYSIGMVDDSHADGIQVTGENNNFSIINCRFDLASYIGHQTNAGIFFILEGDSYNSIVKDCIMTGGNYSFYYGRKYPDAETPVIIENNTVENIVIGCGYQYGALNDNSNSFDHSEVKEADKLFVSSVYKENDKIKLLVTNYTNTEKTLVCVTDKGETEITVPACPTYDEGLTYTDFSQFPFDVEVEVEGGYVVCYDTEVSEENQIRFEVFNVQPESGGKDGKSAYEIWLEQGNVGSEQDFLDSLKGEDGFSPVITVTDTNNGHKVSIEDFGGVKEFEVLDGVNDTEIIHTDLTGFDGVTTVLDLVNALLEEYRTERKNVRFECGSISSSTLTDLPQDYGYLTIKAGGTNILEVTFAYSNLGFKKMYYGFLNRTADETLYSSLNWEEVNTGVKEEIPIIENGKDVVYHKVTKNRSITELESYTDPNGGTGYKIDDLYLTYDCEKLAKGFDDWFAEKGITPVKGTTYEDVAQIKVYSPSAGDYVYLSTRIKFDGTTYLGYFIKYNDTDYAIISVQYDYTNGKTPTTFTGLNVFNIAKIIPELAGCYIQSDILDVLHNWFELYKPIGLEDSVGLYSKQEALLNQDLTVNTSIDSKTVGAFDLGNIVSLMTSPLQKLLFSVDSEGKNLKIVANDEKNRTASLTNGLFSGNLLASKNIFATLNDMSTLPTPPDGALGIWTVVPDASGQPESTNKGGTLIIAHITSMLYSQTINYIGTRIAIYVTQGAIYYALGYGGKYYPASSWTPASGGAFRWYKISSTLV